MNRRKFLKSAAIASGLIYVPSWRANATPSDEAALLVVPLASTPSVNFSRKQYFEQQASTGGSSTFPVTFGSNVTKGNTIIAACVRTNTVISGISDSLGNSFSLVDAFGGASNNYLSIYIAANIANGGSDTIYFNAGSFQSIAVCAMEYSGPVVGVDVYNAISESAATTNTLVTNYNDMFVAIASSLQSGTDPGSMSNSIGAINSSQIFHDSTSGLYLSAWDWTTSNGTFPAGTYINNYVMNFFYNYIIMALH